MIHKPEEASDTASDIPILLKIGRYFVAERQVRSVVRFGKGCKVMLSNGDELVVNINYTKVADLVGS